MARNFVLCCFGLTLCGLAVADDQTAPETTTLEPVVVTPSKVEVSAVRVPADVSIVSGDELVSRGATTMATALSLVPGVEAPEGGDAGPSSSVPSFWGLHEFDAFLLVVDGVPWGGAFNPMITTLDLTDVQRVEVLKGAAPVMFGATAFVGVVQALHYPAGEASNLVDLGYGSYGSWSGAASLALPQSGDYKQSLSVDGQNVGFSDPREKVANEQALYRGALNLDGSSLTFDASLTYVRDVPPSPVNRDGTVLSPEIPVDANFNPADSRINQNQYHFAVGYSRDIQWGEWSSLLSATRSDITDIRAFLEPDLSGAADTQNQDRRIDDDYLDTHLTHHFGTDSTFIVGADALFGHGTQTTLNGNAVYTVPLDGSVLPPPTSALPVNEIGTVNDYRNFLGQYAQVDWKPDAQWDVVAGLRLNETNENKSSSDLADGEYDAQSDHRSDFKLSETLGVSDRFWSSGADQAVLYADFRDAFKPAALDFGPDYQPAVLLPETALSYEAGIKGAALGGRLTYQGEAFLQDFRNLVVASDTGALVNAAKERLEGVEFDARFQATPDFAVAGNLAYHDAHFTQYLFFDGDTGNYVDVGGKALSLSPHVLASAGLLYTPNSGLFSTLVASYVGRRYLDEENTAPVGGYSTLAATVGYHIGQRYTVSFEGTNLTDRRPPVTASEFGSDSFYLLRGRAAWLKLSFCLEQQGCGRG